MGPCKDAAGTLLTALLALCELHLAKAQAPSAASQCNGTTYCGAFCCPDGLNTHQTACCPSSLACCEPVSNVTTFPQCGDQQCPATLSPGEVYDGSNMLRNECCTYFREGCCSAEENRLLDKRFMVAVGIGVATPILLAIITISILVTCYVCRVKGWCCCHRTVQLGGIRLPGRGPAVDRGSMENFFIMEDETSGADGFDPDLQDQNAEKKIILQDKLATFVNTTDGH